MCEVFELSKSGYYRFIANLRKADKDENISADIKAILDKSIYNDNCDVSRMKLAFRQQSVKIGISVL